MVGRRIHPFVLTLFLLPVSVSPGYAQIPGVTEAIIGGIVGASVTAASTSPARKSAAWAQDMYTSFLCLQFKKGVGRKLEQRGYPVTAKTVNWVGQSLYIDSPRPIKAVWMPPQADPIETRVFRAGGGAYRAVLNNRKDLFSKHAGRWEVKILTESGQEVDQQHFYVGLADVDKESKPIDEMKEQLDLSKKDAVIIFTKREVVVDDHYGSLTRLTKRIKLLTDKGKELVEVYIPFISGVETIYVNYAYTIKSSGEVVDATEYGIQNFAQSYPDYTAFRFFSMTLPSLQKGSILEYQILIASPHPKAEGMFLDHYTPRYLLPQIKSSYILNVLNTMNVKYLQLNTKVDVKEKPLGEDRTVYEFTSAEHAGIDVEPAMPSPREVLGEVVISTVSSWDDIAQWWMNLIKDKFEVTPEIQAYVDDLLKGATNNKEKIRRIYTDVSKNNRYVGLDFGSSVYEPADAASVFKNKYGDCKDQSMLLLAMLKAAGISAHTALASSGFGLRVQKDIPTLNEFNHVIVVAEDTDQKYFLDPTLKTYSLGVLPPWLENRYLLHIKDNKAFFEFVPLSGYKTNQTISDIDLNLDENLNVKGSMNVQWTGQKNGDIRWYLYQLESDKQKEEFVDAVLKGVYPYALRDSYELQFEDDFDKPFSLTINFHMDNWLLEAGGGNYLLHMFGGSIQVPDFVAKNRVFPVLLNSTDLQTVRIKLKIPGRFDVEIPPPFDLPRNDYLGNRVHYTYKDQLLQLEQEIFNLKVDVPLDQIDSLRADWEKISQFNRKGVLLKPKNKW